MNLPTADLTSLYLRQSVGHTDTEDTESEIRGGEGGGESFISRSKSPADDIIKEKRGTPDLVPLPLSNNANSNNNNNNNNSVVYSTIQPTGPPSQMMKPTNATTTSTVPIHYTTPFSKSPNIPTTTASVHSSMGSYPSPSFTPLPPPNVPLPPLPHSSSPLLPSHTHTPPLSFTPPVSTPLIHSSTHSSTSREERENIPSEKKPLTAITNGFVHDPHWYHSSSTPSPSHLLPTLVENDIKSDGEDYDHLLGDDEGPSPPPTYPNTSPSRGDFTLPEHKTTLSPILSPRMVPPQAQPPTNNNQPIDLSSLSPILRTSYSSKIHRGHEHNFVALSPHYSSFHARHCSEPLDSVFFPSSPSHPQLSTATNSNEIHKPYNKQRATSHNRLAHNERDFAIEHTLQSCQRPQVIKSTSYTPPPRTLKPHYMSTEGFLNRRPRAFTNDSQSSYGTTNSISTSGRNTPETPRLTFKVQMIYT